jgi:NSS family neurotransmitter:Na+ symporter
MTKKRATWGSRIGFVLAVAGSAVGLANIWRFPYLVGSNGGAAFVLIYLFLIFLVGIPTLLAEIVIGKKTQQNPKQAFEDLSGSKTWGRLGGITILTGFIVSGFYSAVSGWIFGYFLEACVGSLTNFTSPEETVSLFTTLRSSASFCLLTHAGFLAICTLLLLFGVRKGIEAGTKVMMPLLFLTLAIIAIKGLSMPNAYKALEFLFSPSLESLSSTAILAALGQAFFTLSLGQGTMVTYGSYLPQKEDLWKTALPVVFMDLAVSLLAAISVFTIVFSVEMHPDCGPGLLFITLPWVFTQISGGMLLAIAFFLVVLLAAITSEISALEPAIAYLQDTFKWSRKYSTLTVCFGSFLLGVPCALSYSLLSNYTFFEMPLLEAFEALCSHFLIPLGGLLGVLLVGWKWGDKFSVAEITKTTSSKFFSSVFVQKYLAYCFKYICPLCILLIFLKSFGWSCF